MFRGLIRSLATVTASAIVLAGAASAAEAQRFTGQFSTGPKIGGPSVRLRGDRVTEFSARVRPSACGPGSDLRDDGDAFFDVRLAAGTAVTLSDGRFSASGTATSEDYGPGTATRPYGGEYSLTASVNPSHTLITGTVTLADAEDPTLSDCRGTYHFIAIPTVKAPSNIAPGGEYRSQFVSFDTVGGAVVRHLQVAANFNCGGSADSAVVQADAHGDPDIRVSRGGFFSLRLDALDLYQRIVVVRITGRIDGRRARGHTVVTEPPGGYTGLTGRCHGNRGWVAARPTPPTPPGPSASFQWAAIRVPTGAAYRYYFAATGISCADHATAILVTVAGRATRIPCSSPEAFASGPLAPGHAYTATSRAVEIRDGRIVARGTPVTVPLQMPGAGDAWHIISGLPGTPPS